MTPTNQQLPSVSMASTMMQTSPIPPMGNQSALSPGQAVSPSLSHTSLQSATLPQGSSYTPPKVPFNSNCVPLPAHLFTYRPLSSASVHPNPDNVSHISRLLAEIATLKKENEEVKIYIFLWLYSGLHLLSFVGYFIVTGIILFL